LLMQALEPGLLGSGFFEVLTDTFYPAEDASLLGQFDPEVEHQHVTITNALERNCSHVKLTDILHLSRLADFNLRRGVQSFKVFELCRVFGTVGQNSIAEASFDQAYIHERDVISLAVAGRWFDSDFKKGSSTEENLFYLKGVLEDLFARLGVEVSVGKSQHPFLHPGRQASLIVGRSTCGVFGQVHPGLIEKLDCRSEVLFAELDVRTLIAIRKDREFQPYSEYPSIRKDLTLKIGLNAQAGDVTRTM
ncbi:MAG: hypothetical protein KDD53_13100, partial [Bdellovibrionales bacterium]|nr:hypothetical protein [Bdellovibrionales bacterium]